jgi:hypothetical protein
MGKIPPITDKHLLRTILVVIKYFLGPEWIDEHVSWERNTPGFLRVIPGQSAETLISTIKLVDFAELLWNLQGITGFETCIDRIRNGVIEPTCAELDLGQLLYCSNVNFRFVEPRQIKGLDYDIEITLADGMIVCADAKCKVEATDFSVDTVSNSLEKARRQFPKGRPSIIFVKVPPRWILQPAQGLSSNGIAEKFLSGTGRIVSVKFYFSKIIYVDNALIRHDHAFKEISNPNNRFDRTRDWNMFTHDIFGNPQAPRGWNGMTPRWKRLFRFPNEGPT